MFKRIILPLFLLMSSCNHAFATQIVYSTIYAVNGQVTNVNLNGDFNDAKNVVNGHLDNTNADTARGYRFYQTVSVLPAPGNTGQVYYLTTDNSLNFDTGTTFIKTVGISGTPAQGNVVVEGASGLIYLTNGTSGQFLETQGASANPVWASLTGNNITDLTTIPPSAGLIPVANVGGLLGAWTSITENTIFHAATDGFAMGDTGVSGGGISCVTDSNPVPTTIRVRNYVNAAELVSVICPVKKGDYYEIIPQNSSTDAVYWIPLGS